MFHFTCDKFLLHIICLLCSLKSVLLFNSYCSGMLLAFCFAFMTAVLEEESTI